MTHKKFNELVDDFESNRAELLKQKNAKYSPCDDALHNFHTGARIDGSTTCQTIFHYAKKHCVALLDKIQRDDWADIDDVREKLSDIANYIDFMWCAANEAHERNSHPTTGWEDHINYGDCMECRHFRTGDYNCYGDCITEPCKSCQNNFCPSSEEYQNAPINWEPIDETV